jgi:hypothetical protein
MFLRLIASRLRSIGVALLALSLSDGILLAEPIPVRHREGTAHGLLSVRTPEGRIIGGGDLIQVLAGDRITLKLTLHFEDGSIENETTVYSQRKVFRLISDHFLQRGPSFPDPIDISIETATGNAIVRYFDALGRNSVSTRHFDFPPDLANGMLLTLVKNIGKDGEAKVSFVTPERTPMLVKLSMAPGGKEGFRAGNSDRKADRIVVRVELEGVPGLLAAVMKKQPPDSYIWIIDGEAPAVLKLQSPAYVGGPVWVIEQTCPEWAGE